MSRTVLVLALALLLVMVIATSGVQASCPVCEDKRIAASDPTCEEWVWVELDENGNPKDGGITVSSNDDDKNAETTTKTTINNDDKTGGLQQGETDNSWWWKVLIALGACALGLTCVVSIVGVVFAVWFKRSYKVQEYNLYQGAFKNNRKDTITSILEASAQEITNAEDVSDYEEEELLSDEEYEDDDEEELLEDDQHDENINLGHDQMPQEENTSDVGSDGFESDEYDD